jgi:hypothetical protein
MQLRATAFVTARIGNTAHGTPAVHLRETPRAVR